MAFGILEQVAGLCLLTLIQIFTFGGPLLVVAVAAMWFLTTVTAALLTRRLRCFDRGLGWIQFLHGQVPALLPFDSPAAASTSAETE